MKMSLALVTVLGSVALFVGCGGSDGKESLKVGYLVDSPIVGVTYECGAVKSKTDNSGKFECKALPVTFKIGGWIVGTLNKMTPDKRVYPQDLVGVSRDNLTNPTVVNLTRMLQSLDDDGDISKAIKIRPDADEKLSSAKGSLTMTALAQMLGVSMDRIVDENVAIEHLKKNMPNSGKSSGGSAEDGSKDQSSSGGSANGGGGTHNDNQSWTPVTSNFTCDPKPYTFMGYTVDARYAAEGAIKVECYKQEGGMNITAPLYKLDGVESIEVSKIHAITKGAGTSDRFGSFTYVYVADFDENGGKVTIKEDYGNTHLECVETYDTPLPQTISSGDEISRLKELSSNANRISTTCPASYYEEGNGDDENELGGGNFTEWVDVIITDTQNKVHKISEEVKTSK